MTLRRSAWLPAAIVLAVLAASATPVNAQICTLTASGASYVIPATSHYDTSPSSNLTGVGTGDYLFEDGWWFRVSGDAQEFNFPTPDTTTCAAAAGTITWTNVSARGFSASLAISISSAAASSGEVLQTMTINNLSAAGPLTLDLFHFADFDVNGSFGTDNATLALANTYIQLTDTTAGTAEYHAFSPNANAFMVRPFSSAGTDVAGLLSDALVTNLDNSGLPFVSGDFTGGFQWSLVIPASGTASVTVAMAGNQISTPVTLQGFSVE